MIVLTKNNTEKALLLVIYPVVLKLLDNNWLMQILLADECSYGHMHAK